MMREFELAQPRSAQEASAQLSPGFRYPQPDTAALAGGQDILALMKDEVIAPGRLVNLKTIPGLNAVRTNDQGRLILGALATLTAIADSDTVRRGWPILAKAAGEAATLQIRNLGTVGGNLCQRPRCWYYRSAPTPCFMNGGDVCLAVAGDNRYHAIFSEGMCNNPFMSSLAIPLMALGATIEAVGPEGKRYLPIAEFYATPTADRRQEYTLAPGEIVTHVIVPPANADGWRWAHEEVRFKQSHDWPLAMATVGLRTDGGRANGPVREARVVLGAVRPIPHVAQAAQAALVGQPVTRDRAQAAADAALADAQPLPYNEYKVPLTRNLLRNTILAAAGQATTGER